MIGVRSVVVLGQDNEESMGKLTTLFGITASLLVCTHAAKAEGTQWAGTIKCSYGSGSLNIMIDRYGDVHGGVTNGRVTIGNRNGTRVKFETSNAFGNRAVFTGQINGFSMSGTYTQGANRETCNWQAKMVGVVADKPKSLKKEASETAVKGAAKTIRKLFLPDEKKPQYRHNAPSGSGPGVRG
jgi:hypothetical protein